MTRKEREQEEYRAKLREILPPGTTVYTILRHVSRSGMMRHISAVIKTDEGIQDISYWVARAIDEKHSDKNGGIKMGGCGMDMGFDLVYRLAYALYPDGFDCVGEGCPSNDHSNHVEATHHKNGGCALRHNWL